MCLVPSLGRGVAAQGMPLDCLHLETSGACVHEFNGMVAKKETVPNWPSPHGSVQKEKTEMPNSCCK